MSTHLTPEHRSINVQESTKFTVHVAARLECARDIVPYTLDPTTQATWEQSCGPLVKITRVPEAGPLRAKDRRVWDLKIQAPRPLKAKECSRGLLPYLLPPGTKRGKDSGNTAPWRIFFVDLDCIPGLSVKEVLARIDEAFGGVRRVVYTTYSCADGIVCVRVLIFLGRDATMHEVQRLPWWARRRLLAAALPEVNTKGKPVFDLSVFNGGLVFLPAVPTPMTPGVEDWGGVLPQGGFGSDGDTLLDVDAAIAEAQVAETEDATAYYAKFPKPVKAAGASGGGSGGFSVERRDFSQVEVAPGVSLLTHANRGGSRVGNPFVPRAEGDPAINGTGSKLQTLPDGSLWLISFPDGVAYVHEPALPGVFDFTLEGQPHRSGPRGDLSDIRGDNILKSKAEVRAALSLSPKEEAKSAALKFPPMKEVRWTPENVTQLNDPDHIPLEIPRARVTYVRAPQGKGKTELAASWVRQFTLAPSHLPVLSIVHRRTLSAQQSQRLGLTSYLDVTGALEGDAVVCLDSLHRRVPPYVLDHLSVPRARVYGLVILDEVSQLLRHIYGGTMSGYESLGAWTALRDVLQHAKYILCLDADLDAWTIARVRELLGLDLRDGSDQELRWWDVPAPYTYRLDVDSASTDRDLFADWANGKTLAVYVQSRRASEGKAVQLRDESPAGWLAQRLLAERPSAKVIVINSDRNREPEVAALLADPSRAVQYDAIVYTGTMGTGFSIDVRDHFDAVYVYSSEGIGTVQDLRQGAHRVRHPRSTEIRICCPPRATTPRERDPQRIYEAVTALGDHVVRIVGLNGPIREDEYVVGGIEYHDGVAERSPYSVEHTRLYTEVLSYERTYGGPGGTRHRALVDYLRHHCGATVTVTDAMDEALAKPIKKAGVDARKAARVARATRVFQARDLTAEEAENLRDPGTLADSDALEKYRVREFYGVPTVALDLILRDDEGKYRGKCRAMAKFITHRSDPEKVIEMDRHEVQSSKPLSHWGMHHAHAEVMDRILKAAGLPADIGTWKGTVVDPHKALKATKVARSPRGKRILGELGITVRRDAEKNPIQFVTSVLGKLGVGATVKESNGQRTYTVRDTSTVLQDCEAYLRRISHPERGGDHDDAPKPTTPKSHDDDSLNRQLDAVLAQT